MDKKIGHPKAARNTQSSPAMCWCERLAMNNETWLERLQMLCERFSHLGLDADLAALSIVELWGLYCYLSRLADMQGAQL